MSIEPSQAHTVHIRAVLPPKPAPVTLAPKLSMAEEARLISKRFHRAFGFSTTLNPGGNANRRRMDDARRARAETANRIAALLGNGAGMTAPELQTHFTVSQNHIRTVLKEMAKAGRVTKAKGALGVVHWRLAESKEGTE